MDQVLEISGTLLGLAYVVLLIYRHVWAWPCGMVSSAIMAYSFYAGESPLYLETVSYIVYVLVGGYGWYYWLTNKDIAKTPSGIATVEWTWMVHVAVVLGGLGLSYVIAIGLRRTDDARPIADALSTVFALIATWMQARKVRSNWLYWVVIDLGLAVLYTSTGYNWYVGLMVVYVVLAIKGYAAWNKVR